MKKLLALIFSGLCLQGFSNPEGRKIDSWYDQLQQTFSTITNVEHFGESAIPGIYEVIFGGKAIYYYPEKDILIFGEMFNKEGVSLTGSSLEQNRTKKRLEGFDSSKGLALGDKDGIPIIEILNPDCFYCRKADAYITQKMQTQKIRRIVFFSTDSDNSRSKANHIFCSENPQQALAEILNNEVTTLLTCEEADQQSQRQQAEVMKLGIDSTPGFILGETIITGFKPEAIDDYLESMASN